MTRSLSYGGGWRCTTRRHSRWSSSMRSAASCSSRFGPGQGLAMRAYAAWHWQRCASCGWGRPRPAPSTSCGQRRGDGNWAQIYEISRAVDTMRCHKTCCRAVRGPSRGQSPWRAHRPAHLALAVYLAAPCLPFCSFEITGGIPQTLPRLLDLLKPSMEAQQVAGEVA